MVVDLARHEIADDEVVAFERLVRRRRLVNAAGDGLVVVDGERVRVQAAVPADHVERVRGHDITGADDAVRRAVLDKHLDLGLEVGDLDERGRSVQVALAERGVLEELTEPREVTLRRHDVAVGSMT